MIDKSFVQKCQAFIEPNRFRLDEPMKLHTTFKIGGPADCLIFPASMEETEKVLALVNEYKLPLTILGNGSNVLVQDKGIRGVVVKFARPMAKIRHEGTRIIAGAGALLKDVSEAAAQSSISVSNAMRSTRRRRASRRSRSRRNAGASSGENPDSGSWFIIRSPAISDIFSILPHFFRCEKRQSAALPAVESGSGFLDSILRPGAV